KASADALPAALERLRAMVRDGRARGVPPDEVEDMVRDTSLVAPAQRGSHWERLARLRDAEAGWRREQGTPAARARSDLAWLAALAASGDEAARAHVDDALPSRSAAPPAPDPAADWLIGAAFPKHRADTPSAPSEVDAPVVPAHLLEAFCALSRTLPQRD